MEAALRHVLTSTFSDYASGIDKADTSNFPVTMRNLVLKPKRINEDMEDSPFVFEEGTIGAVKINPGWMGNVDVEATGIKVKLSFSAVKAAKLAMKPTEYEYVTVNQDVFLTNGVTPAAPMPPPPPQPPQWCPKHDTSEKRTKREPHETKCSSCGITYTTSYDPAILCPPCSGKQKRCLICGEGVDQTFTYIPATHCQPASMREPGSMTTPAGNLQPSASMQKAGSMQLRNGNLQPSDSMPVLNKNGLEPFPAPPPGQQARAPWQPPSARQGVAPMSPVPGPTPVPYRRPNSGKPTPQQEPDDSISAFLGDAFRHLTCNAAEFDNDEYEVGPPRARTAPMRTAPMR